MRWPPAEICLAALVIAAACSIGTDTPHGYQGEIVARRTSIDTLGQPVIVLTVGWEPEPDKYEQDTREYPLFSPEARFSVGDCVRVQPYGQAVRLSPCR